MGDDARALDVDGFLVVAHLPNPPGIEAVLTQALLETRKGVEAYFAVISKIRRFAEDVVEDGSLPVLDSIRGCPTCFQLDGFHDNGPHATARAAIPAKLTWKPGEIPVYRRGR